MITRVAKWHANMTERNHLGNALIIKPYVFEDKMEQLFSSYNYYSDNPMSSILMGMGKVAEKEITSDEWEWGLKVSNTKPLIVLENVMPSGNTTVGQYKTAFKLKLNDKLYSEGDIIAPGDSGKIFQCRIQKDPEKHGNGYIYTVKLMTDDPQLFLPQRYLKTGVRWGKLFSQYGEGGSQSGSTQFAMPITMKNRISRYRKKYEVTGDVAEEVLCVKVADSNGKLHDMWIKYAEVEYWQQWYKELEKGIWYSRKTNSIIDESSGRPIYSGSGIQEQMEGSHRATYNTLTAKFVEEYLMDIFYSRVKPGKGRHIKGFTGEYGMLQFHRAIQKLSEKRGFVQVVDDKFIKNTSSPYHDNALAYGYQYTKYLMGNGSTLELVHNPIYDDTTINTEIDPVSGFPMESQRITFLDFAPNEGTKSNIQIVKKKGSTKLGYVAGLTNPFGVANNNLMANSKDGYEMHVNTKKGVHIHDVSKCGELILGRR